jgi:hypothetical protein
MRQVSEQLGQILDGGQFVARLVVDVFYGADRTLQDVPVGVGWQVQWRRDADVPGSGRLSVMYSSKQGESMSPKDFTDALAPFGQEVALRMVFLVGDREESVQVGRWQIDDVPSARDDEMRLIDRVVSVGSYVDLVVLDALERVQADGFAAPSAPPAGATAWGELRRLTGMAIQRVGADPTVPSTMQYAVQDGGRLKAVRELAAAIGGTPYVRADGVLTVLPFAQAQIARRFEYGANSTVFDLPHAMSKAGVCNVIVGVFEDDSRNPISVPPARQLTGPLRVDGPFGVRTKYVTSRDYPLAKTATQVADVLAAELARSTTLQTVRIPVETVLDPRVEIGDTVALERSNVTEVGAVQEITYRSDWRMVMGVDVTVRISEDNSEA